MSDKPQVFHIAGVKFQAWQLLEENGRSVWEWAPCKSFVEPNGSISGLSVFTAKGRVKAEFGDWIVRNFRGKFSVYKPDAFEAIYGAKAVTSDD